MLNSTEWDRYLQRYWDSNPQSFEEWLFDFFLTKYDNATHIQLDLQELLHIDLWKNGSRNKSRILKNLEPLELSMPSNSPIPGDRLETLILQTLRNGIRVRTASAVLTVLRPSVFSVIDRFSIMAMRDVASLDQDPKRDTTVQNYVEYMMKFWSLANSVKRHWHNYSFRNLDRALWAYGLCLEKK